MKLSSGIADVTAWQAEGLTGAWHRRARRLQQRPLHVRGDGLRGKLAKVSRDDRRCSGARARRGRDPGGARALGLSEKIGSLEPGKQADVISVDVRNAHVEPFEDVYSALVYSVKASDVTDVWVEGRRLLSARRPTTLDEKAILDAAVKWRARIHQSLEGTGK